MNEQQRGWNSAYRGRAARSMNQAFGPYCDNKLQPMADPIRKSDWVIYLIFAFVVVGFFVYLC